MPILLGLLLAAVLFYGIATMATAQTYGFSLAASAWVRCEARPSGAGSFWYVSRGPFLSPIACFWWGNRERQSEFVAYAMVSGVLPVRETHNEKTQIVGGHYWPAWIVPHLAERATAPHQETVH